jgi:hypothetical protein
MKTEDLLEFLQREETQASFKEATETLRRLADELEDIETHCVISHMHITCTREELDEFIHSWTKATAEVADEKEVFTMGMAVLASKADDDAPEPVDVEANFLTGLILGGLD